MFKTRRRHFFITVILVLMPLVLLVSACQTSADSQQQTRMEAGPISSPAESPMAGSGRQISVTGQASQSRPADLAIISAAIRTSDKEAESAIRDNAEKMNSLLKILKDQGLPEKNIHSSNYNIGPEYDYSGNRPKFIGYEVSHSLELKIEDVGETGQYLDLITANGVNEISQVYFDLQEGQAAYQEALGLAIADAKNKAQLIQDQAGLSGELQIERVEELSGYEPVYEAEAGAKEAGLDQATPILPDDQIVRARVRVVFNLN